MAVGDSITAGAFAEGIVSDDVLSSFGEWRGKSYAGGGDPGALTVPNVRLSFSAMTHFPDASCFVLVAWPL